jgi:pyridoxine 5-phosphate synthase
MITLNVNIDHIATLRNARGGTEPDPVEGAIIAQNAGAEGIVCHLREDRRHIKDRDLWLIKDAINAKLDLEMGANEEILNIALNVKPDLVTIVPENRQELTTEGGLNVAADISRYRKLVDRMHDKNILVSFFIEPDIKQIDSVLSCAGDMVEFHTGVYANLTQDDLIDQEFNKIKDSALYAKQSKLRIAAGHGLNYQNTAKICAIHEIDELSIGHSVISRAVFVGLQKAVQDMLAIIDKHQPGEKG